MYWKLQCKLYKLIVTLKKSVPSVNFVCEIILFNSRELQKNKTDITLTEAYVHQALVAGLKKLFGEVSMFDHFFKCAYLHTTALFWGYCLNVSTYVYKDRRILQVFDLPKSALKFLSPQVLRYVLYTSSLDPKPEKHRF